MKSFNIIRALTHKDILLFCNNRKAILINLLAPIVMAAFFGYVFSNDVGGSSNSSKKVASIPIAIVDLDASATSAAIVASFGTASAVAVTVMTEENAISMVRSGKRHAAIVIPKNFGIDAGLAMARNQTTARPEVTIHFDPSKPYIVNVMNGLLSQYAIKAVMVTQLNLSDTTLQLPYTTTAIAAVAQSASSPRQYNSFAHSFAGMSVQFILFMGIDFGIGLLLMRREDIWKRLRVAPISRADIILARIVASTLISIAFILAIYSVAMTIFGVRVDGSWLGFIAIVVAFAMLNASFGLLIATIGKSPEAARGLAIFATLILVMLGGAWVPSFVFPEWLQSISHFTPTYWAVEGLSAMTWRGLGIGEAVKPIAVMLGFAMVFAVMAMWRFRWEE
jgi:ABC-2 type transport system permease protein